MKRLAVFWIAVILVSPAFAAPGRVRQNSLLRLASSRMNYSVEYDQGRDVWAGYIKEKTEDFLPAAEEYLSFGLPRKEAFAIRGKDAVYHENQDSGRQGIRVGGANFWDYIGVEYGLTRPGNPALLFHELGHFWFKKYIESDDGDTNWLTEGIVSFLPVAMSGCGFLDLQTSEIDSIYTHWGIILLENLSGDRPVYKDFRYENWTAFSSLYYVKTFFLQYMLYLKLGPEKYRNFLQSLLRDETAFSSTEKVIDMLNRLQPDDWKTILTGWVYKGPYAGDITISDFTDPDCDGILSAVEKTIGTDPDKSDSDGDLIPDGVEKDLGFDPAAAESTARVQKTVDDAGPFPDGNPDEWRIVPYMYAGEPSGDCASAGYDLTGFQAVIRRGSIYILVRTSGRPEKKKDVFFDILADINGDKQSDMDFAFFTLRPLHPWKYSVADKQSEPLPELHGGMAETFEISIPLAAVGTSEFSILPIVRDENSKTNFDQWDSWIEINTDVLKNIDTYKIRTNLENDDADSDGIPDVYELRLGLNPAAANSPADIARYGPFIDGMNTEWNTVTGTRIPDRDTRPARPEYDISEYVWTVKDGSFVIAALMKDGLPIEKNVFFDVLIDENGDNDSDFEFAFFLTNPRHVWKYSSSEKKSSVPRGTAAGAGAIIELSIPLSFLPEKNFRIYPIIQNMTEGKNYEEYGGWIQIDLQ